MGAMAKVIAFRAVVNSEGPAGARRLTKRLVESIKPDPSHEVWVWDSELKGFGLRVMPRGIRTYVVQYRDAGHRTRRLALGRHGVITAEEARKRAMQRLAAVAAGANPSVERQETRERARGARSVSQVMADFLGHVASRRKPSTAASYQQVAHQRILPRLGRQRADELTHETVRNWHQSMERTPYGANRALAILSAMYGFMRLPNPCKGIERFPERARDRFYSPDELRRLGAALAEGERTQTLRPDVVATVRLLALTGCRAGEVRTLKWEHVDTAAGVLRLADAKAGARNVPLCGAAIALLEGLPRTGPYVVGGNAPMNGWTLDNQWSRIRKSAGITNGRIHDLRHSLGTYAGAAGLNAFAVRDLLGHKTLAMTHRYVSAYTNPLRAAANEAAAPIVAALNAGATGKLVE
jgi:integrase